MHGSFLEDGMNRHIFVLLLVAGLIIGALPLNSFAEEKAGAGVEFGVEGYYRIRYDNHFKTDWLFDDDSDWYSYFNQRMLLTPTLQINEKIKLVMQLDILRNVTFGSNRVARIPTVVVNRDQSDLEQIEYIRYNTIEMSTGNILSQEMSNTDMEGQEVYPIQVRRLYGEVKLPFGVLRVGRQGSQFGLGLFSNAGDGLDDDYGDTYDRLLFGTKVGPWVPVLIYDKVVEDSFKVADSDVHQIAIVNYAKEIKWGKGQQYQFDGGVYFTHRWQHTTSAKIFAYDLWLRFMLAGFRIETEVLALQGQMVMFDNDSIDDFEENGLPTGTGGGKIAIDAYINANQFWYETDFWGVGAEVGFSSPADPDPDNEFDSEAAANVAKAYKESKSDDDSAQSSINFINSVVENQSAFGNHVYTFPFDKDYTVDLVIWEMLMGGAVKNGIYAKLGGYVSPLDLFKIQIDILKSWINESGKGKNGRDADHDLGWELDLDFSVSAADHFTFGFQFGYAWPGQYFMDKFDDVQEVYTVQTRFVFDF